MQAWLAVSVPGAQRAQIRMCHETKKITQFRDVQLTVLIAVSHLKLCLDKAQQLRFAYFAVVTAASALSGIFRHSESPHILSTSSKLKVDERLRAITGNHCPAMRLKMVLKPRRRDWLRSSRRALKSARLLDN
jgi:hypothetical protein